MRSDANTLENMVNILLSKHKNLTPEAIRDAIDDLRVSPVFAIDDDTAEVLARRIESRHKITMGRGEVLRDREYEPWLDGARLTIDPYYWDRYAQMLGIEGFSNQVIASVDDVTDRTLGLLENPRKDGPWDRRGMVVGHVQSGKTANYIGLIAKAADAGYKLIVVIAGVHNNLRNQTQSRVDEGFIGIDSARLLNRKEGRYVGVGKLNRHRPHPAPFTNSQRDFNKRTATSVGISLDTLKEPAVFVIKKNSSTLTNLVEWLKEYNALGAQQTIDIPMLLIDDEADNASINTSTKPDRASRINGQIRDLLKLFNRSCYVGYTATPFANIFIDPNSDDEMRGGDLFPKNFIISLDPPSNYFGPEQVFANYEESPVVRHIEDNEDFLPAKQTKDMEIVDLPDSLLDAMRTFVVARAVRLIRGHEHAHCSMMVNASVFTNVQTRLRNEIHHRLTRLQNSVRA